MHKIATERDTHGLNHVITPEPAIPAAFGSARAATPEQRLALAVMLHAWYDLDDTSPPEVRDDAWDFLSGGPQLDHWCGLIGVEPEAVRRGLALRTVAGVL